MSMKPVTVDLPFPSIDVLTEDLRSATIISPAYATSSGEYKAVSQYIYHHFNFYQLGLEDIAQMLENIAIAEMRHFDMLGKMLHKLGVNPVMSAHPPHQSNFFSTCAINYSTTPQKMIMDNIEGELKAIDSYNLMLTKLDNEQVSAVIKRILLDEELHFKVLSELLTQLTQSKIF